MTVDSLVIKKMQDDWKGFDPYTLISKKHGLTRDFVKWGCLHLFYSTNFDPKTKEEAIEGIEKHLGLVPVSSHIGEQNNE